MLQEVNNMLPPSSESRVGAGPSSPRGHPPAHSGQEASQRLLRRYRKAKLRRIQRKEYLKLRAMVPAVACRDKVSKVTVIEEAIKYIDELHQALTQRLHCPPGPAGFLAPASPCRSAPDSSPHKSQCPRDPDTTPRPSTPPSSRHCTMTSLPSPLRHCNRIS